MFRLLLVVAACLLAACGTIPGAGKHSIPSSLGGEVYPTMNEIRARTRPVVLDGSYTSAATMWLGHPQACVTSDSRFHFHAPSWRDRRAMPQALHTRVVNDMAEFYPGPLSAWFKQKYGDKSSVRISGYATFSGSQLSTWGVVRHCQQMLRSVIDKE